jgi:hypothetical protein
MDCASSCHRSSLTLQNRTLGQVYTVIQTAGVAHVHTHTHTHTYIYIYIYHIKKKHPTGFNPLLFLTKATRFPFSQNVTFPCYSRHQITTPCDLDIQPIFATSSTSVPHTHITIPITALLSPTSSSLPTPCNVCVHVHVQGTLRYKPPTP